MSSSFGFICLGTGLALGLLGSIIGKYNTHEPFVNVPLTVEGVRDNGQYLVPGNYQASLEPRFSNTGYGAVMNQFGNPNMSQGSPTSAVPAQPLGGVNASPVEGYNAPQQLQGAPATMSAPMAGRTPLIVTNELQVDPSVVKEYAQVNNTSSPYAADAAQHRAVFDRLVYSTKKSRQLAGSDFIRGDLPIIPILPDSNPSSNTWMRPSASIERDLRVGAAYVLSGANDASARLQQLKMAANPARRTMHADPNGSLVVNKNPVLYGHGLGDLQLNVERFA